MRLGNGGVLGGAQLRPPISALTRLGCLGRTLLFTGCCVGQRSNSGLFQALCSVWHRLSQAQHLWLRWLELIPAGLLTGVQNGKHGAFLSWLLLGCYLCSLDF